MDDKTFLDRRALLHGSAAVSAAVALGLTDTGEAQAAAVAPATVQEAQAAAVAPASVQDVQDLRYTATNTTYGTAAVEPDRYVHCEVVFVAPESGRVIVHWSGALRNLSAAETPVAYLSPEVRSGATPGSGGVVLPAHDARTVRCNFAGAAQTIRAGASHLLSGLTPGESYNARILHRVTSSTGEFFYRSLIVTPTS
ncbi:MAG TPA: hypothetical protein VF062_27435 [Candidatus Limnocylindrales bacterium]